MEYKKKASTAILAIYRMNRNKLEQEMLKARHDKVVANNIQAYKHILAQLEQVYEIPRSLSYFKPQDQDDVKDSLEDTLKS